MSKAPEDRNPELRAIFFESANELLQSLNEAGLELEARPADEEVIRRVRRAVHTLKGDSAAVGFHKLSQLAHELEDILTPQVAQKHGSRFAEVVLAAADSFEAMLAAYQRSKKASVASDIARADSGLAREYGSRLPKLRNRPRAYPRDLRGPSTSSS